MHFAQVAFAMLAGGAAILIVAGLVFEAVHGKEQHRRQRDLPNPVPEPAAREVPAVPEPVAIESLEEGRPFVHSRGDHERHDNRDRSRSEEDSETTRQRRKKKRRKEKGNRPKQRSDKNTPMASAETEDA